MPHRARAQGITVAVACLALAGAAGSARAQPCVSCWDKSCPELKNYGSPACKEPVPSPAPAERKRSPRPGAKVEAPADTTCLEGQSVSVDTSGHCCWPGQVWSDGRCRGVPSSCPARFHVVPEKELCDLAACTDGRIRAPDKLHCCWAGQVWSVAGSMCVGVPAHCPRGFMVKAEQQSCAPLQCDGNAVIAKDGRGCTPCGEGYAADEARESCKLVPCPGAMVRARGGVRCQECQRGFRADASGRKCELIPCVGDTIRAKDGVQCSPCPDGQKADSRNKLCRLPPCEGNTVRSADPTHPRCEPAAPAGTVLVRGGRYQMGRADYGRLGALDVPAHPVQVKDFALDRVEVTVGMYKEFIEAVDLPAPWGKQKDISKIAGLPAVNVAAEDAAGYCRWRHPPNGRLPSEEEWEWAARGAEGRLYPWGNEFMRACVNGLRGEGGSPQPAEKHACGATPSGVLDLSGNVWEWTSSRPAAYPGSNAQIPNGDKFRIVRGGSFFNTEESDLTTTVRQFAMAPNRFLGFRCAIDIAAGP